MTDGNDTPVPGRPSRRWRWATQALRRPPTPMSSQCSGPHRGVVGDSGSTRDQDQICSSSGRHRSRTPSRENSPTPSDASSGGPAVSGSVGTDRIAVADAAEDGERCWNCSTPNSNYIMRLGDGFFCSIGCRDLWHHEHPDSDHGARGWPEAWDVASDAASDSDADRVAVSDVGEGVLINDQNAPGLGDHISPGPRDPDVTVMRDELRARWIAAGVAEERVEALLQCGQNRPFFSQPWIDPNAAPDIRTWWQQHVIDH